MLKIEKPKPMTVDEIRKMKEGMKAMTREEMLRMKKINPNAVAEFLEKNPSYVIVNETITVDGTEFQLEEAIDFTM